MQGVGRQCRVLALMSGCVVGAEAVLGSSVDALLACFDVMPRALPLSRPLPLAAQTAGHANALRQAKTLGDELVVSSACSMQLLHRVLRWLAVAAAGGNAVAAAAGSNAGGPAPTPPLAALVRRAVQVGLVPDSEILRCKGPPILCDEERLKLVQSVKWVDEVLTGAPPPLPPLCCCCRVRSHGCAAAVGRDSRHAPALLRSRSVPRRRAVRPDSRVPHRALHQAQGE